jgi:hypothetical protein
MRVESRGEDALRTKMNILRIALLVALVQNTTAQGPIATLQGIVSEMGRDEVVWGACVELRKEGTTTAVYGAVTGADGKFDFPSVQPGRYQLLATHPGHVPAEYGQNRMKGPGIPITLTAGQRMTGARIAMTPTGAISGRVMDASGEPIALADVFALKSSYQEGQRFLTQVLSAKTDERGEFRIFWITPGLYYINVIVPEGTSSLNLITNDDGNDSGAMVFNRRVLRDNLSHLFATSVAENEAHVPIYYPNTPNPQQAQAIDVRPGYDIKGINLVADVARTFRIRGVITNGGTGEFSSSNTATAVLLPSDPAGNSYAAVIESGSNPFKFEIKRVVPGSYFLFVQIKRGAKADPAGELWGSMPLEVTQDVENISIAAKPTFSIHGNVIVEGRPNRGGVSTAAGLFLAMRPDPFMTTQAPSPSTRVLPDGTFTFSEVIAGGYRAYVFPFLIPTTNPGLLWGRPSAPAGLQDTYVKSIRVGGANILGGAVHLIPTLNLPMEIVLGSNPGALDGRVVRTEDGKQVPAFGITVGAVPDAPAARGFRTDMHRSTLTDESGTFQFRNLPPGDYRLFAWEAADKDTVMDLDFIRTSEDKGTRVHIDEGEKKTIDLTMIPERMR